MLYAFVVYLVRPHNHGFSDFEYFQLKVLVQTPEIHKPLMMVLGIAYLILQQLCLCSDITQRLYCHGSYLFHAVQVLKRMFNSWPSFE